MAEKCREKGIVLSKKKIQCGRAIKFAGHVIISEKGIKPDPEKLKAITHFPRPKNITDLRSFCGLINQLASFVLDMAKNMANLQQLLKKNVAYIWMEDHENEFMRMKNMLTSDLVVKPFDPSLRTELITDASRLGLGYFLRQIDEETGEKRLIECGSCSLKPAEKNYAVIELEL